ncbi:MAG: hypothetical protein MUP09_03945 [Thiovulaceae bacterium]|nr:hypothetical protein [Sulfurimonadaceae bacterium]
MKGQIMLVASMLLMTRLYANDGFSSEFGHKVGGAITASGIKTAVDYYYPQYQADRGMIGFSINSAAIVLERSVKYALHRDARGQLLDAASHVACEAIGNWASGQYILLSPVIREEYFGVGLQYPF